MEPPVGRTNMEPLGWVIVGLLAIVAVIAACGLIAAWLEGKDMD